MFKKIGIVIKNWSHIDELLRKEAIKKELERREADRYRLRLCYMHRQERNRSVYSQKNCDYCILLKKLGEAKYGD
jgi:hypothetical protein